MPPPEQRRTLALLLGWLAIAQIDQPFPRLAPLQHLPTLALIVAAPWLLRRWPLSNGSVGCIAAFLALHTLAGRYIYSYVPYDAWSEALTGRSLSLLFGWERNDFDRLVHFSFGLLSVPPARELLSRHIGMSRRAAAYVAVEFVLAFSCLYEIFEWLLTVVMAGADADAYNGQQGDIWDSQKDMAMATLGACVSTVILAGRQAWRRK